MDRPDRELAEHQIHCVSINLPALFLYANSRAAVTPQPQRPSSKPRSQSNPSMRNSRSYPKEASSPSIVGVVQQLLCSYLLLSSPAFASDVRDVRNVTLTTQRSRRNAKVPIKTKWNCARRDLEGGIRTHMLRKEMMR